MINKSKMTRSLRLVCTLVLVGGCAYNPGKTETDINIISGYKEYADASEVSYLKAPERRWWKRFNNKELVDLLEALDSHNLDMKVAYQRINQSKALLGQQSANSWPELSVGLSQNAVSSNGLQSPKQSDSLEFTASYELDVWGKRDAANVAAALDVNIAEQRFNSLALQLQAALSQGYFEALALKQRYDISRENLKATEDLFRLIKLRFDLGQASMIELNQQQNILLKQRSKNVILERDLAIRKRALAVLTGMAEMDDLALTTPFEQLKVPQVLVVQPATLLESRPDIRIAELELKLTDARLFQAKAKRWPSLTLSAQSSLQDVFSGGTNWATSILDSITAPVFNGGRIKNQIRFAEIETDISLDLYKNTVLKAMQETLDTLTTLHHQRSVYQLSQDELKNNRQLYDQAVKQYRLGAIDFLTLLAAQRSWFDAQENIINSKLEYLTATVNTFRSMGNSPFTQYEKQQESLNEPSEQGNEDQLAQRI